METLNEKQLLIARQEFTPFLSLKKTEFAKLKLKTPASFFKQKMSRIRFWNISHSIIKLNLRF